MMSAIYDNWERLVAAVLKKEQLWQLFHQQSRSPSPSTCSLSSSSDFSFSRLASSLDDVPFGFSSPDWSASDQIHYGAKTPAPTHSRRRDLTIQVPEPGIEDRGFSRAPVCSEYSSKFSPTVSPRVNSNDVKKESYPLPLPPTPISNSSHVSPPKSAVKLPSPPPRTPKGAENVKSPGTSWKKGKLIGRGPFGDVYLGFSSEKGQMCAMKELSLFPKEAESARFLEKEIALLSHINHPNIVQYYGSEMVADNFYIYFEYVSGGSISMILQQYGRLGESVISNYTQQILSGLAYLHSNSIAHRNVKGASLLVDPNGKVKLCNFAIEKDIAKQSRISWFMDSCYWMAPEAIMDSYERKLAVDIWSLGCTILEMATTRPPLSQYDRGVAMFKIANHKELPQFPDHLSDVCKDFLRHCLQWNPHQRSTASQLLDHPFVKNSMSLGKQILVSTSSVHPAVTNAATSEGTDHARSPCQLDSGKVISRASKASKSNFQTSDIYTPRNISAPVSLVGSPLPHPRSAPLSPVGSPLPYPRSAPLSPVESPLPHPRSGPVSPVESPLPRPRSPQPLNRLMSPPPKSSPRTAPKPMISGVEAIPHSPVNQSLLRQDSSYNSSKFNTPSYWDPNILRGVFRFS